MARSSHLLIFQKTYDLLLRVYQEVHNFPREYKYDLGEKIKLITLEIMDQIIIANSAQDKIPYLKKISQDVDRLRIYIRLCYSLSIIGSAKYETLARFVDEIGKMTGGWLKSC